MRTGSVHMTTATRLRVTSHIVPTGSFGICPGGERVVTLTGWRCEHAIW